MSRTRYDDPDEDDAGDWGAEDDYGDDGPATVACPYCRAEILEDAEQCPKCGQYISKEDMPTGGFSAIGWVLIILMLFAAALWAVGRG